MILNATDDIRGVTTLSARVDYTISLTEKSDASGLEWLLPITSQLPSAAADLYSCPASTQALVDEMTLHNTGATTEVAVIYIREGAGTQRVWFRASLDQNETAHYIRGRGWTVFTSGGLVKTTSQAVGTVFPTSPFDGQAFYRTDLDWAFRYDSGRGEWLGEIENMQLGRNGVVGAGTNLRFGGNKVADPVAGTAPSWPYPVTIVAMEGGTDASAEGDLILEDQAGTELAYVSFVSAPPINENAAKTDIDVNMSVGARFGIVWGLWSSAIVPSATADATAVIWFRRRSS